MTIDSLGRKRPRDPNQLAKLIVDIASGQRQRNRGRTPLRSRGGQKAGNEAGRPAPLL